MAITETGYHRSTFEEILADLVLKAQELFGEDIDVSEQTPLGKILNMMAYVRGKDHELAELIYYSRFPNTASGTNLDRLCPFLGITRNVSIPARYEVEVTGDEGTTIPVGFLVATESGIEYYNTMAATIEAGATTCTITVECTTAGTMGNVTASEIVEIVNPEAGITSIVGTNIIMAGVDEESDNALRQRMQIVGEGGGSGNEASIRAALLRVPTVTSATVIVDDTNHSITCYVAGGDDYSQEIAEAIFMTKPVGIKTNGDIAVIVTDDGGFPHTINYSNLESISVSVSISISTTVDFEGDTGIAAIQKNVADYINSLGFGTDLILSALYGYIYSVTGVEKVTSLQLSTDGTTYTTDDIPISNIQCAICNAVNVTEV